MTSALSGLCRGNPRDVSPQRLDRPGLTVHRDALVGRAKHVQLAFDIADRVNPHGLANIKLQSADLTKQTGIFQFRQHIRRRPFIQI